MSTGGSDKGDSRREKSLGILCQKFIMLFLISSSVSFIKLYWKNTGIIALDYDFMSSVKAILDWRVAFLSWHDIKVLKSTFVCGPTAMIRASNKK